MAFIIFLVVLSALVIVHELGHFSVAKYFGIRVDEFGVGYPPRAKKLFHWKGTKFTLNYLPFGGFVKIFGEDPNAENIDSPESFQSKNRAIQAAVLFAGVLYNFIFAWLLIFIVLVAGLSAPLEAVQSGAVSFFPAVVESLRISTVLTIETTQALGLFLFEVVSGNPDFSTITGPVGLVGLVGEVSLMGLGYLLTFTALISINLCIINLLPFPALDGGRLLFVGIESVVRKKIPSRVFNFLNAGGFALLILLMVFVTIQDVRNLF